MGEEYNIQDELNRKAIETLEAIILNHESGSVDLASTKYAINTLFGLASGLLSAETFEIVSQASKEYGRIEEAPLTRMFLGPNGLIAVTLRWNETDLIVRRFECEGMTPKEKRIAFGDSVIPSKSEKFRLVCDSIEKRGFTEI